MQGRYFALAILMLVVGLGGGVYIEKIIMNKNITASSGPKVLYWVAPMDPNFRRDEPGLSPMGMDLVPVYEGNEPSGDPSNVELSAQEINAIGVRTAVTRLEPIRQRIDTVGFVSYNEHKTNHIHTRVEGWIERLYVRAVGDKVRRGDLLFELFSPQISIATYELLRGQLRNSAAEIRNAKRKLRSFGMSQQQITKILQTKQETDRLEVYAPQDGIVVDIIAADGMYLEPEIRAVTLTDLSSVWLMVDIFERDIGLLSKNMYAAIKFDTLPEHKFEGKVDFVYTELDPKTRTLPVRLKFKNPKGLLKPNMFGSATLFLQDPRKAITVPNEAVIRMGGGERVILKTGEGTFIPRVITTGLRDSFNEGGRTEVLQGLQAGEQIVASAQFLIDSESALSAGLMRMAPTKTEPVNGEGEIIAINPNTSEIAIQHQAINDLGWPEMKTSFVAMKEVMLDRFKTGQEVRFKLARGSDGLISMVDLRSADGIAATARGIAHAIAGEGRLSISHDPIPELNWPSMEMEMDVVGLDVADVPLNTPFEFDLMKGENGMYVISAVRADVETNEMSTNKTSSDISKEAMENENDEGQGQILRTNGRINTVDPSTGMANITHGPLNEIGMPGMTMNFNIDKKLNIEKLPLGKDITVILRNSAGQPLSLIAVEEAK